METIFVEPCCASHQLPAMFRENELVQFQTNGDVTFEHIIKSVASLAGNVLAVKIMMPIISIDILRVLAWFGRRGWLMDLQVVTRDNQAALIHNELSDNVPSLKCYHHDRAFDHLLVIEGEKGIVTVTGRLLSDIEPGIHFYTAAIKKAALSHMRTIGPTLKSIMRTEDAITSDNPPPAATPLPHPTSSTTNPEASSAETESPSIESETASDKAETPSVFTSNVNTDNLTQSKSTIDSSKKKHKN